MRFVIFYSKYSVSSIAFKLLKCLRILYSGTSNLAVLANKITALVSFYTTIVLSIDFVIILSDSSLKNTLETSFYSIYYFFKIVFCFYIIIFKLKCSTGIFLDVNPLTSMSLKEIRLVRKK